MFTGGMGLFDPWPYINLDSHVQALVLHGAAYDVFCLPSVRLAYSAAPKGNSGGARGNAFGQFVGRSDLQTGDQPIARMGCVFCTDSIGGILWGRVGKDCQIQV